MSDKTDIPGSDLLSGDEITEFIDGYSECALWAALDLSHVKDNGDSPTFDEQDLGVDDLTPEAQKAFRQDCIDFIDSNAEDLLTAVYEADRGEDFGFAGMGHDFFLTRNGHGTGFWDRGLGDIGDRLTANCKPYGEVNLYSTPDGKVETD